MRARTRDRTHRQRPRTDHGRGEPRAFLVGPDRDLDRRLGFDAVVIQGAYHLETGEYSVDAVELPAGRLTVQVTAGSDRREVRIGPGSPREQVPHRIDPDFATGRGTPLREQLA